MTGVVSNISNPMGIAVQFEHKVLYLNPLDIIGEIIFGNSVQCELTDEQVAVVSARNLKASKKYAKKMREEKREAEYKQHTPLTAQVASYLSSLVDGNYYRRGNENELVQSEFGRIYRLAEDKGAASIMTIVDRVLKYNNITPVQSRIIASFAVENGYTI